ncbi:MAG: methyltransferase domain-containing protein [Phaeodactylibacter sp.]|nr:methyltransferase domain-containing protein [Phaeodactylibacter sp.]
MTEQELQLLIGLHSDTPRQGPGSPAETRKAMALAGIDKRRRIKMADIGCGSGAQTMDLAENSNALITAVDLFPGFLERLQRNARAGGLQDRITTVEASMDNLPFADEEFDVAWSEGAIYNMGFEEGVKQWRRFIKPGGYLVASEVSWITGARPAELEEYWAAQYPQIDTISGNIRKLEQHGYSPTAHFILPEYCWTEYYYGPLQKRFPAFLSRHGHSDAARAIVENEKREIGVYEKYKDYYSYAFYIGRKIS